MKIDIRTSEEQGVMIFDVAGRVDGATAVPLGEQLQRALKRDQVRFALDLSLTDYVSSAGLREIVSALKDARDRNGNLVLVNPSRRVMETLEMTGLVKQLAIFATRDEALRSFA